MLLSPASLLIVASLFQAAAPVPSAPPAPPPEQETARERVTVSFDMAENMVEWLEAAHAGASDEALRERFFAQVAPTAGCQAIVAHWARFREWNEEVFYRFVLEALGRVPTDAPLVDGNGAPTRLGFARPLWQAAAADPAAVRRDLEALRAINLRGEALARARRHLPASADLSNAFHVVLFGASSAFSVGESNGFDLLQLPKTAAGGVDVERTVAIFAHEIHHSGFATAYAAALGPLADDERLNLPGLLVAEGTATFYLTPPWKLTGSRGPMDAEVAADWARHSARMAELYAAGAAAIARGLDGALPAAEIHRDWLGGALGTGYALGVDMVRTIDAHLGHDAVLEVFDVRRLLVVYNRAARKANAAGGAVFVFDDALAERLRTLRVREVESRASKR